MTPSREAHRGAIAPQGGAECCDSVAWFERV
jgi:hypothetical protein